MLQTNYGILFLPAETKILNKYLLDMHRKREGNQHQHWHGPPVWQLMEPTQLREQLCAPGTGSLGTQFSELLLSAPSTHQASHLTPDMPVALGGPASLPLGQDAHPQAAGAQHSALQQPLTPESEMISAPLGEFCYTMYMGQAEDAFGDTCFLNNKASKLDTESLDKQESSSSKSSLLSQKFLVSNLSQLVPPQQIRADKVLPR